jgi:hypothetical protein
MFVNCTSDLTVSVISHNGFTFNLATAKTVRRTKLDDPLVVVGSGGSIEVTSWSPSWDGVTSGAMLNPDSSLLSQGYDNRNDIPASTMKPPYDATKRVTFPITLVPGDSLIVTLGKFGDITSGGASHIAGCAVLTCVADDPGPDAFRPAYVAGSNPQWTGANVDYTKLLGLPVPTGATLVDMSSPSSYLNRTNLEHGAMPIWGGQIFPVNHGDSTGYSYGNASAWGRMAVQCHLDDPNAQSIADRLIQQGIDLYPSSLVNGERWSRNGGHGHGRKWPIIFAGIMLNDAGMKSPPLFVTGSSGQMKFQEDAYTYMGNPGGTTPRWGQAQGITGADTYLTDNHTVRPSAGDVDQWEMYYRYQTFGENPNGEYLDSSPYEICCGPRAYVGPALAARLMQAAGHNAMTLWNNPTWFAYVDRYVDTINLNMLASGMTIPGPPPRYVYTSVEEDTLRYGGNSTGLDPNLLMKRAWETYR